MEHLSQRLPAAADVGPSRIRTWAIGNHLQNGSHRLRLHPHLTPASTPYTSFL
jgi:hypothetical protein